MNVWVLAVIIGFLISQVAAIATTVYLHRGKTHNGLRFKKSIDVIFRAILWMTTGQKTKEWVAVHRKHHKHMDTKLDPHSPKVLGFWKVQIGNVFLYKKEANKKETVKQYAPEFTDDNWDKFAFNHGNVGLLIGIVILCFTLGFWPGLLAAGVHTFTYIFLLTTSINGLCHVYGKKNFNNDARNMQSIAFVTGGEGLHNNHHAFPSCPKLSMRRSETDLGWIIVWILLKLKLCTAGNTLSLDNKLHPTIISRLVKAS